MRVINCLRVLLCAIVSINFVRSMKFPDDFLFGVATASYQVEGAWNESGKGENIWDRFCHENATSITDLSNGDIAASCYYKSHDDILLLKELGVNLYRFSISWSRILPTGFPNHINEAGVQYYNDLINVLLENNITPMVTIYHWDLPQPLQELGGWPNPMMVQFYEDYVNILFELFGDRVKMWITFNEPFAVCEGYSNGRWAPGYTVQGVGNYLCGHTILKAHARAYRLYEKKFKPQQGGKIGITIGVSWYEPHSNSTEDLEATERLYAMEIGWFTHPIFSAEGDYPEILKERVGMLSKEEHFSQSRLPEFTPEEIRSIRGSYDFFGLNHYTANLVRMAEQGEHEISPSYDRDVDVVKEVDPSWPGFESRPSMKVVPEGMYNVLMWIKNEYNNPIVYVTENGFADFGQIKDYGRVTYMQQYIDELSKAVNDGANVKGYCAWSFLDNFEWLAGYTQRYGLFHVDINHPERKRTAKLSSFVYRDIIKKRVVDFSVCSKEECQMDKELQTVNSK